MDVGVIVTDVGATGGTEAPATVAACGASATSMPAVVAPAVIVTGFAPASVLVPP